MKKFAVLAVAAAAACAEGPSSPVPTLGTESIPSTPAFSREGGEAIPGRYIVVLRDESTADVAGVAHGKARRYGASVNRTYSHALKGFVAELDASQVAALRADPDVAYVEEDQVVTASTVELNATWGLDRVDQRSLPLNSSYSYAGDGTGVTAYIIDTGILFAHSEFGGRAVAGVDEVTVGGSAADCNGHGTHVSGTVGGSVYGVAKNVRLVAVRVLDCGGSGSTSGVIAGIDWVTANHSGPSVANMSLGGGASTALDQAVSNSIASGVTYAIAAGNGNFIGRAQDACRTSPSRVAEAITVSATDKTDTKASWANYGTCVDIFAPGVSITSSWYTSPTATNTISGTSMATPHVAGVAALYLGSHASASPQQVRDALVANGTGGVVKSAGKGSPNVLLFSNY